MRKPITIDDHQASRWIVEPLHLLDCCLISDGGVCVIVTTAERARDLRQPPVLHLRHGAGVTPRRTSEREDWWYAPHQKLAVADAYTMAGVGPRDIDVAQLYDNFTISVLLWFEHGGFCKPGEAGPFCRGRTHPARRRTADQHRGRQSLRIVHGRLAAHRRRRAPDARRSAARARSRAPRCAS